MFPRRAECVIFRLHGSRRLLLPLKSRYFSNGGVTLTRRGMFIVLFYCCSDTLAQGTILRASLQIRAAGMSAQAHSIWRPKPRQVES
ncbi:hypothetical protein PSPO01_03017 [Paraphaeosphaeria sporulosa]